MSAAVRSAGSSRRGLRQTGEVDESLFGTQKAPSRGASSRGSHRATSASLSRSGTAIVSAGTLSSLVSPSKESAVLSGAELHSILNLTGSLHRSNQHQQQQQHQSDQAARAAARKAKMLRLEQASASRPTQLSPSEVEEKENRQRLLVRAKAHLDEEHDDAKHMRAMMHYAQCVTIRDAQVLEKSRLAQRAAEEERRLDAAMEAERVRTLKLQEEREAARAEEQRLGASVIIQQIQERERERLAAQEAREQEAQAMLQRVRAIEQREEEERAAKVRAGRQLLEQVMDANQKQAAQKLLRKQEEVEEELRIQAYIRAKEARDAANEAELARVRADKEREVARLRAMQERAQDRQAQIDELRAKRYQEAKEREWRSRALSEAQKKEGLKRDIAMAREAQRQEKARRIAEQALQEREEYMRVLEWQNGQTEVEQMRRTRAADRAYQHKAELQSQIAAKEREQAEARKRYLSEGAIFAAQNARDKARLEALKAEKLAQLEAMGVPAKYRSELAKKKVLVASIH